MEKSRGSGSPVGPQPGSPVPIRHRPGLLGETQTADALATGVPKRPAPALALRTEDESSQALGWNFNNWAGTLV